MSSTIRRTPDASVSSSASASSRKRAAALVAVEPDVAAGDVLLGDAALPGSRDAHHEDHVRVVLRRAAGVRASRARPAERAGEGGAVVGVELERRGAGRGARRLGPPGARDRDDDGREVEQPGERDLGRGRAARVRDLGERLVAGEAARPARPAERRVGDHGDPRLGAALDDSSAQRARRRRG